MRVVVLTLDTCKWKNRIERWGHKFRQRAGSISRDDNIYVLGANYYFDIYDQHTNLRNLPHTGVISRLGKNLKELVMDVSVYYNPRFTMELIRRANNTHPVATTHKSIIKNILHYCPHLKYLELNNFFFAGAQDLEERNRCLQALNLKNPYPVNDVELVHVLSLFPSLKYFNITNSYFTKASDWNVITKISMDNHQLEDITWEYDWYRKHHLGRIYLKVSKSAGETYLSLNGELGTRSLTDKEEYDEAVHSGEFICIAVTCVSLKTFTIVESRRLYYECQIHDD